MSDANLLTLAIGPASLIVRADREVKGISEPQLEHKRMVEKATDAGRCDGQRRLALSLALDWLPRVRIEWR